MIASEVFKIFDKEVIPRDSKYKWTGRKTQSRPSWEDFTDKRVAVSQYHLNQVENYLKKKHFCILVGDKDTGKTWLSYVVGYNLVEQGKRVRFATIDENFNEKDAWNEIKSQQAKGEGKPERYYIIEDCHTNSKESEEFFQRILDEGEENLRFLFTMRKTSRFLLEDVKPEDIFYLEGTERECVVCLLLDNMIEKHVKNIINKFIEVDKIKYEILDKELEDVAKGWGNDLYWIWLRLKSWNYSKGQKLSGITDDQVYEAIWSHRGEIKLNLLERQNVLHPLSVLCQFEPLKVYELANFLEDNQTTLNELRDGGIVSLSRWSGCGFVSISENFADLILSTMLTRDLSFRKNEISEQAQIFKDYLKSNPPGWHVVFRALYLARAGKKSKLAKEILTSLWNDVDIVRIVKENVKDITVGQMVYLIDSLLWVEGKDSWVKSQKAQEIRSCYIEDKNMQDKLKYSSARTIMDYLPLLSRIFNLNTFFDVFEISDYEHIINLSTIHTIRRLFGVFQEQHQNIPSAAKKMANALPDADVARLVSLENVSLFRLGGLIGNVRQVDPSAAERFVKKLSESDLTELLSREDPTAEEKGYTKVKVINYFLSRWISFTPLYRKEIVDKISDDVWDRHIRSAPSDDGFWLLWNIYVNNSNKAKCIVQNSIGEFLFQKCVEEQKETSLLPLLGILHLCDFMINDISIKANITEIEQMLAKFKKENKPTHLVLSLVALKVKLPSQQFENVKGILDERLRKFIRNAPDIRVSAVISNLIECHCN